MHKEDLIYHDGSTELQGFLAYDESSNKPKPAVLVAHDWTGRNPFACDKALQLAHMGYVGFALDMYGHAHLGNSKEEKSALIQPFMADRAKLLTRVQAAFNTVSALPQVDTKRIVIIGFCFGGLCALDLARSGAPIWGAVSFHGLLSKPALPPKTIQAKVLALHGYDDPMATPQDLQAFCAEMTAAKVDWQVQMYGQVQHAFTNPQAHDVQDGLLYNAKAAERSWLAMSNFLNEM